MEKIEYEVDNDIVYICYVILATFGGFLLRLRMTINFFRCQLIAFFKKNQF